MVDSSKLAAVELTLNECRELLASAAPSPTVRELRVRHGALARVTGGWRLNPPHSAQLAAMLECTMELRAMVVRICPLPRPGDPTTLPGVGSLASGRSLPPRRSSRPPPRRSSRPPAHGSLAPRRNSQRSTRPPPFDMSTRTTRPPPGRPSGG